MYVTAISKSMLLSQMSILLYVNLLQQNFNNLIVNIVLVDSKHMRFGLIYDVKGLLKDPSL